jgi:hypothetical protein
VLLLQDSSSDVTVTSLDSDESGCISPAELLLVDPPQTCFRPVLTVTSASDTVTSSPGDEMATSESSSNSVELTHRHRDIEQLEPTLSCISSSVYNTARSSDDVDITRSSHSDDGADKWRNRLEKRNVVRRLLLLTASVIDGKDDIAAIILLAIITLLFMYVTSFLNRSAYSPVSSSSSFSDRV